MISKHRSIPLEVVGSWHWAKFLYTYRQVGKTQWDEWSTQIQTNQIAVQRALASVLSKKALDDLPSYEDVAGKRDPFAVPPEAKRMDKRRWLYLVNNKLPIPPGTRPPEDWDEETRSFKPL